MDCHKRITKYALSFNGVSLDAIARATDIAEVPELITFFKLRNETLPVAAKLRLP